MVISHGYVSLVDLGARPKLEVADEISAQENQHEVLREERCVEQQNANLIYNLLSDKFVVLGCTIKLI